MKIKLKHLSDQIRDWCFLAIFVGVLMLTMRLYAPVLPQIPILSVNRPVTNSVTITVTNGFPSPLLFPEILQMSTNLTAPNWINLQTNSPIGGVIIITNIPATNPYEFFRTVIN